MDKDAQLYALHKLSTAEVYSYPFKYIYITQIFPDYFYQELMENVPTNEYYAKTSDSERTEFSLKIENLQKLPIKQKEFWESFSCWICGEDFSTILKNKLDLVTTVNGETAIYEPASSLTRSWMGYNLPPHTDIARKALSLLIYLAKDDMHKDLGTAIFLPKDRDFECDGTSVRHPFEYFEHYKTLEFKPNTLSAFCRSTQSFHGVYENKDPNFIRDTVGYVLNHMNFKKRN